MVSDSELAQIVPALGAAKRAEYLPLLQSTLRRFGITSRLREAAFLSQLAHESGGLHYLEEIASGAAYEGRADLGNSHPGDGTRFKGRGFIQLTGRYNYRKFGQLLGLRLEQTPEIASRPEVAFDIAGLYWQLHGLNLLADRRDFRGITKAINGGFNGLASRLAYYHRALAVLNNDGVPNPITVVVCGAELENSGTLLDDLAWIPLRETLEAAHGSVLRAASGQAELARRGYFGTVPLQVLEGVGYAPARHVAPAIGMSAVWVPADRTVTLEPLGE